MILVIMVIIQWSAATASPKTWTATGPVAQTLSDTWNLLSSAALHKMMVRKGSSVWDILDMGSRKKSMFYNMFQNF